MIIPLEFEPELKEKLDLEGLCVNCEAERKFWFSIPSGARSVGDVIRGIQEYFDCSCPLYLYVLDHYVSPDMGLALLDRDFVKVKGKKVGVNGSDHETHGCRLCRETPVDASFNPSPRLSPPSDSNSIEDSGLSSSDDGGSSEIEDNEGVAAASTADQDAISILIPNTSIHENQSAIGRKRRVESVLDETENGNNPKTSRITQRTPTPRKAALSAEAANAEANQIGAVAVFRGKSDRKPKEVQPKALTTAKGKSRKKKGKEKPKSEPGNNGEISLKLKPKGQRRLRLRGNCTPTIMKTYHVALLTFAATLNVNSRATFFSKTGKKYFWAPRASHRQPLTDQVVKMMYDPELENHDRVETAMHPLWTWVLRVVTWHPGFTYFRAEGILVNQNGKTMQYVDAHPNGCFKKERDSHSFILMEMV